ncbi:MAG: UDP-N-acetylmuramoyl-L-alanine--D-glutamate ligase [Actinomycetota bacterium]|nr:UDP-N-acetylmuramoyl-L-alanine--D-glutamate ligase [Actinomycetota bacterium]
MRSTALVHGIALAGEALAAQLVRRDWRVLVADDAPTPEKRALAASLGTELVESPDAATIDALVAEADMVCPAPGVPETHAVVLAAQAAGVPLRTEIDLAYEWEQQRAAGPRPMLAVTGTDGKTTTTLLAAHMLEAAGVRAAAVGNTEVPLSAALDEPVDAFVVECSSFRLNWLRSFRAEAAVWLNFAPDHQNWHTSMASYEAAKARVWANRRDTDVAIGFADDAVVMRNLRAAGGITRTFAATGADYRVEHGSLVGPDGVIAPVSCMTRALPHDLTNALAAAALVLESGLATAADVQRALGTFRHPPHRIEPVGEIRGVQWFNDSKATSPHAALTAIRGFERIVLLAGGLNKGLDLAELAVEHRRVKAVVGLGTAALEVTTPFAPHCPTRVATSMAQAVAFATELAEPGDVVLLSPACASFDWYPGGGYPARGDDFKQLVRALAEGSADAPVSAERSAR